MTISELAILIAKIWLGGSVLLFAVIAVSAAWGKRETEIEHERLAESDREAARSALETGKVLPFRQRADR